MLIREGRRGKRVAIVTCLSFSLSATGEELPIGLNETMFIPTIEVCWAYIPDHFINDWLINLTGPGNGGPKEEMASTGQ